MGFIKEFKEFAVKGNVVDMAIGVVIGGAFGKIVTSLLNDVLMPPLGLLTGGIDFTAHRITLKAAEGALPAVTLNYGAFLTHLTDFLIVAFAMFMAIRAMNTVKRLEQPPAPLPERSCPECLMPIPREARRCGHCCSALG